MVAQGSIEVGVLSFTTTPPLRYFITPNDSEEIPNHEKPAHRMRSQLQPGMRAGLMPLSNLFAATPAAAYRVRVNLPGIRDSDFKSRLSPKLSQLLRRIEDSVKDMKGPSRNASCDPALCIPRGLPGRARRDKW